MDNLICKKTFERVKQLVVSYDLDGIVFYDENFLADSNRAMKIAELIDNKFRWSIQWRMDDVLKMYMKRLNET